MKTLENGTFPSAKPSDTATSGKAEFLMRRAQAAGYLFYTYRAKVTSAPALLEEDRRCWVFVQCEVIVYSAATQRRHRRGQLLSTALILEPCFLITLISLRGLTILCSAARKWKETVAFLNAGSVAVLLCSSVLNDGALDNNPLCTRA
ncbi:hypothetical protein F2P81_019390 [Scophthalmus maximus]|uniref:Uncharacterized protein n=1 Tax=Scophthalmus maximus TaxID=52904 RepID=A0A6A4S1S5_SCOMX|nr:hypothetical protein F2P81_019390 [Scophthalmus maximus]